MDISTLFLGSGPSVGRDMFSSVFATMAASSCGCLLFQKFQIDDTASRLGVISFLRHQRSFVQVGRRVTGMTGSISSDGHHVGCDSLSYFSTDCSAAESQNFVPRAELNMVSHEAKFLAGFKLCHFAKAANFIDIITVQLGETRVHLVIVKGVPVAPKVGVSLARDFCFYSPFSRFEQKLGNTSECEDNPSHGS